MRYCIDRFEGEKAVLLSEEDDERVVSRTQLARDAAEGDWGQFENGLFCKNDAETLRRRAEVENLLARLLERGKK